MLLRLIRGNVIVGREADFVAVCRQQSIDRARAPGLIAFLPGYRRVDGHEQFVMAAVWDTEADAIQAGGDVDRPAVVDIFDGIAAVETFDVYSVVEPAFRGIVDSPGGVIRVTTTRVSRDTADAMFRWLAAQPRGRVSTAQRLLLGWVLGTRVVPDTEETEVVAVSAWPSPLVIEAIADPDRAGAPLYADIDQFGADVSVEQYRAVALELPETLSDVGSRRVIAARFDARAAADAAAAALTASIASPHDAQISVAGGGAAGAAPPLQPSPFFSQSNINTK
jgi:hypothetical protein